MKPLEARLQPDHFQDADMSEVSTSALQSGNPEVRSAALEGMRSGTEVALEILLQSTTTQEARKLLEELEVDGVFQDLAEQDLKYICEEAQALEDLLAQAMMPH